MRLNFRNVAALCTLGFACSHAAAQQPASRVHVLRPTPTTVAWGHYDAATPPALRINSGDAVDVHTLIGSTPARLQEAGVPGDQLEQALKDIHRDVTNRGAGPHILTGPIYVEGAMPGDVLEVRIESVALAIPYAYNGFRPGAGFLPDDFPYARMKIVPLDSARMVARFADGIEVPLRPFFGSMGVAPPEPVGRIASGPPWVHAGNLDNKELVQGTTLFIPIHVRGALFQVGDGHAAQGNGEVDLTALETSLTGRLRLTVRKDMQLRWPRAETPTHYITMGIHEDLSEATRLAVRETIDFLVEERRLSRDDAYALASVAVDFSITQLVDGNKGVHGMIPKSLFTTR